MLRFLQHPILFEQPLERMVVPRELHEQAQAEVRIVLFPVSQIRLQFSPRRLLHAPQLLADARKGRDAVVIQVLQYLRPQLVRQPRFLLLL